MINCLVITYGNMAKELISIAEKITGKKNLLSSLDLPEDLSEEDLKNKIEDKINSYENSQRPLVLIDVFASPHSRVLIDLKDRVKIVSGVNLPMVIAAHKSIAQGETSVDNMVKEIQRQTVESVLVL